MEPLLNLELPIQGNSLKSREDLITSLSQILSPFKPFYSKGKARLDLGNTGTSYSGAISGMEGFSRILWGLVPLLAGGEDSNHWDDHLEGIINGTNPSHEEYWGEITNFDQRAVEMAAFGYALALIPERIWDPLNDLEKENLFQWLNQINQFDVYDCNWLFFPVLVNLGFKQVGLPYDREKLKKNLDRIDDFYLEDGWYADGMDAHCDYYGPFAIHFYSLLYSKLMREEDTKRAECYRSRAETFAKDFIYWFSNNGSSLPYGRSLTYRFAQSAFWSALIYADVESFSLGVMKGILMRNLRWWFRQPIFDANGLLTIGYRYPNLVMAENYNAPGSPYWALKTYLVLALPKDHPFWTTEEEPLPALKEKVTQASPRFIIHRKEEQDHVVVFNAGYQHTNDHPHTHAKYEKFVYSNFFGFSVSKGEWGLGQGAFDSMLAVSEGDHMYRGKRTCEEYRVDDDVIYTRWKPWRDVDIQTWLVTGTPWHIRIHKISTGRKLDVADGGFALGLENSQTNGQDTKIIKQSKLCASFYPWGASGIQSLDEHGQAELIYAHANTNVMQARTVIPTIKSSFQPGTHWMLNAVFGEVGSDGVGNEWEAVPEVKVYDGKIVVGEGMDKMIIPF